MSNKRYRPDDITDPVVSGTYRELADERTTEHLDHVVLNEARGAAQLRHRRTVSWLRPAAWATTIGLCLAIVLEIADIAQDEEAVFDAPAKGQEESIAGTPASEAENRARLQTGSDEESGRRLLETAPAPGVLSEVVAERYCSDSETGDPNSWLECIQQLEKDGLYEAARIERELLKEAFPPPELP